MQVLLLSEAMLSCLFCQLAAAPGTGGAPRPPVAEPQPRNLTAHGQVRIDPYYWLKERDNPKVIAYLEAENQYTAALMKHTEGLQAKLFEEIKGRIKQTDMSVPYLDDGYYYYTRQVDGKQYPLYCRKKGSLEAAEQVMLDVNDIAAGHKFCSVRGLAVSPDGNTLAYAVDTRGRRIYTLHFKDLATGALLPDVIPQVTGNVAWANDNRTLFYTRQHPETLRSYRIFRHTLGADPTADERVYEEPDDTFSCYVRKTKSKRFLMIVSSQTLSDEVRYLDADQPGGQFKVFLPRERNHEYNVDHFGDRFFVRTNHQAKNFRLMAAPLRATARENWQEIIPHRPDVLLSGFELFKDHLVVRERKDGLVQLQIRPWSGGGEHYLDFGEPAYIAYPNDNREMDSATLRFTYSSMTTPRTVYDYDMVTRKKKLLKQEEVLGGFDSAHYETERVYAMARDGTRIPVSMVYRKGTKRNGHNPLLLYGYGSYGASMDAGFSSPRLSLIDRGFIFAIAHVRGGQELGREWYDNGKLLHKKNTFTDFIDCAEYLVAQRFTNPRQLYALGGSAGGLLMGAVVNMRPDLFHGVVARVPFVDIITTMLDPDIPLTTSEYDEWGDPNNKEYYDYILSYSPYDNVAPKAYPNLLVTTGLHDSQVQYWEPAKWVAKLRVLKTDRNRLLLKTNLDAGHGGASGRYERYRETAFYYAFLLDLAGRST